MYIISRRHDEIFFLYYFMSLLPGYFNINIIANILSMLFLYAEKLYHPFAP